MVDGGTMRIDSSCNATSVTLTGSEHVNQPYALNDPESATIMLRDNEGRTLALKGGWPAISRVLTLALTAGVTGKEQR